MAIKSKSKYPETGWGVPFKALFREGVEVRNLAKNGRSTKSFRAEGLWDSVRRNLKPQDYVFIQFGHNDEKVDKPHLGTSIAEFEDNLKNYVRFVQERGATAVLLTPIVRRKFEDGRLVDTHQAYGTSALHVARELGVSCIDLNKLTADLLSDYGEDDSKSLFLHLPEGSKNYPKGVVDNTHLNVEGAQAVAGLVAEELKRSKLALAQYLK